MRSGLSSASPPVNQPKDQLNSQLLHTQSAVIAFVGANCAMGCWSHYPIDRAMVVASLGQPALQLGNRRSIAVSVAGVAVVTIIVSVRRIIPVRIIAVVIRVGNAPGPIGVPTRVVRITIIVPIRRIIPIRIIAVAKGERSAPAPGGVPTPGVRITKSTDEDESVTAAPVAAAPVTATPASTAPVAVFSRFSAAEFRTTSAKIVSASRRSRAKMFAVSAMPAWRRLRAKMLAVFGMISVVSAVSATSAMFRQSSAYGDGDGENDRKERFHGTKVFVAHRLRAFTRLSSRLRGGSPIQTQQTQSAVFIGTHNEPLVVVAVRVTNEDRSPVTIRGNTQPQLDLFLFSEYQPQQSDNDVFSHLKARKRFCIRRVPRTPGPNRGRSSRRA